MKERRGGGGGGGRKEEREKGEKTQKLFILATKSCPVTLVATLLQVIPEPLHSCANGRPLHVLVLVGSDDDGLGGERHHQCLLHVVLVLALEHDEAGISLQTNHRPPLAPHQRPGTVDAVVVAGDGIGDVEDLVGRAGEAGDLGPGSSILAMDGTQLHLVLHQTVCVCCPRHVR